MDKKILSIKELIITYFLLFFFFITFNIEVESADKLIFGYSSTEAEHLVGWIGKEKGFYNKYKIDAALVYIEGGSKTIMAMVGGDAPVAQVASPAVILSNIEGSGAIFLITNIGRLPYWLMARSDITKPSQLKGKKIITGRFGGAAELAARLAISRIGLDPDRDVILLQSGGNLVRMSAVISGVGEATVLAIPANYKGKELGLNLIVDLFSEDVGFIHSGVAATESYINRNEDLIRRLIKGHIEAIHFIKTNMEGTIRILGKYAKLEDKDMLEKTYKSYMTQFPKKPYVLPSSIQTVLDTPRVKNNPKAKNITPEKFYNNRFVQELDRSGFIDSLYK